MRFLLPYTPRPTYDEVNYLLLFCLQYFPDSTTVIPDALIELDTRFPGSGEKKRSLQSAFAHQALIQYLITHSRTSSTQVPYALMSSLYTKDITKFFLVNLSNKSQPFRDSTVKKLRFDLLKSLNDPNLTVFPTKHTSSGVAGPRTRDLLYMAGTRTPFSMFDSNPLRKPSDCHADSERKLLSDSSKLLIKTYGSSVWAGMMKLSNQIIRRSSKTKARFDRLDSPLDIYILLHGLVSNSKYVINDSSIDINYQTLRT